jgi:hypothetical protein
VFYLYVLLLVIVWLAPMLLLGLSREVLFLLCRSVFVCFITYVSLCVSFPVFINGLRVKFMLFSLVIIGWSNVFVFSNLF